jgi:hypothetical protein
VLGNEYSRFGWRSGIEEMLLFWLGFKEKNVEEDEE